MANYSARQPGLPVSQHFTLGEFFTPGAYLDVVNPKTGARFTLAELTGLVPEVILDDALLPLLEDLRAFSAVKLGAPVQIHITPHGGFRPKPLNAAVGGARASRHIAGQAADLRIVQSGRPIDSCLAAVLAESCMQRRGTPGGVGCYGPGVSHIHVDCRGSWAAWYIQTSGLYTPAQGGRSCVFRKGHRAAGVALLQRELCLRGFPCGGADGRFGEKTLKALKAYQLQTGLKADGLFGPQTNAAMGLLPWET